MDLAHKRGKIAESSGKVSSTMVIGIGIVIFIVIVGFWYLFLK